MNEANQVVGEEYVDVSLEETTGKMKDNVSKIADAKTTFEKEMQDRFMPLVDNMKKLNFKKIKLLEDIDFMIRDEIHDITEDSQHKQTPAPIKLEPPKTKNTIEYATDQPLLQFFEEADTGRKEKGERDLVSNLRSIATPITASQAQSEFKFGKKGKHLQIDNDK